MSMLICCNSFYFYIKPQLIEVLSVTHSSCNSFYFYIKPQHSIEVANDSTVVIHSISTSNHNISVIRLFITVSCNSFYFYIKPQHSYRKGYYSRCCNSFYFYIKPQLLGLFSRKPRSCNSFYFYIKPQQ